MKEKGLKFLKEKPDCVKVWLIALTVMIVALFIISCVNIKCSFLNKIPDTLLSGIIGALLSCAFVLFGFHLSNTAKAIDNQLELRKLFSEELRWEVHRTLDTGDKSYWYEKSGEEMPESLREVHGDMTKEEQKKEGQNQQENGGTDKKKSEKLREEEWQESQAFKKFFEPALNDYMGVFEIAYMMIKEGQMSKNNFAVSYYYRLVELTECKVAMEKVNNSEVLYWLSLRKLIKMFSL